MIFRPSPKATEQWSSLFLKEVPDINSKEIQSSLFCQELQDATRSGKIEFDLSNMNLPAPLLLTMIQIVVTADVAYSYVISQNKFGKDGVTAAKFIAKSSAWHVEMDEIGLGDYVVQAALALNKSSTLSQLSMSTIHNLPQHKLSPSIETSFASHQAATVFADRNDKCTQVGETQSPVSYHIDGEHGLCPVDESIVGFPYIKRVKLGDLGSPGHITYSWTYKPYKPYEPSKEVSSSSLSSESGPESNHPIDTSVSDYEPSVISFSGALTAATTCVAIAGAIVATVLGHE